MPRVATGYFAVTFIRTRAEKGKTKRKVYIGSFALYEARKGREKNDRVKERDETSARCRQSEGVRRRREGIRGERRRTRRRARSLPRPRPFPPPGGNHMLPGFMSASNASVSLTRREGRTFPVSPSHPRPSRETARSALLLPAYPPRPIARLGPPPVSHHLYPPPRPSPGRRPARLPRESAGRLLCLSFRVAPGDMPRMFEIVLDHLFSAFPREIRWKQRNVPYAFKVRF